MMKQAAAAMVVALSAQGAAAKDSDYPGKWVRQAVCSDVVQSVAAPIEGWKWVAVLAWAQGYQFGHAISAQQNGGEGAQLNKEVYATAVMMQCRDNPGMDVVEAVVRVHMTMAAQ